MKTYGRTALLVLLLVLVLASGAWGAMKKAEMINGAQWAKWSEQNKLVYIRGICNYVDFDAAAQIQTMKRKSKRWFSISIGLAQVLKTKTLGQVVADIDNYYRNNPGNQDVSVIEVIFKHCAKMCPSS
jgi:hypothetical protein